MKEIMSLLKKLRRLLEVQMMIKECNLLIWQKHMHMEQANICLVKMKWLNVTI